MAGRKAGLRGVLEEPGFTAGRELLLPDARRWDEFWIAAEWALVRDPSSFDPIPDYDLWVIVSEPSPRTKMPRLRVFYRFDDEFIYLKWVERA